MNTRTRRETVDREEGRSQEYSNSRQELEESLERIMDDMAAAAVASELADGESDPDVKEILSHKILRLPQMSIQVSTI